MPKHDTAFLTTCNRLSCFFGPQSPVDFSEPFALFVARNGYTSVSVAASARVDAVHSAFLSVRRVPEGLAALVGHYMDCHMDALLATHDSVRILYMDQRAPEHCSDRTVCCYPLCEHAPVAVKAWHSQLHHEVTDIAAKLLRKGGPTPSSVRYVSGLLRRCASDGCAAQPLIRCMILSHKLGNYRHSKFCAARVDRVTAYTQSVPALCEALCASMSTKELHGVLTEFVAALTLMHQALLKSIGLTSSRSIANPVHAQFGGDVTRVHTVPLGYSVFSVMIKALNVHHTTLAASRGRLSPGVVSCVIDEAVHASGFSTTLSALKRMGLGHDDALSVRRCFTQRKLGTLKMMRLTLKTMSAHSSHVLALYLWAVRQVLSVSVGVLHARVRHVQQKLADARGITQVVVVCLVCASVKTAVNGIKTPKTKMGVAVDPTDGSVCCNSCGHRHVKSVNMIGRSITVGSLSRGVRNTIISCACCTRLTCNHRTLGLYPLCMNCFESSHRVTHAPSKCFCERDAARGQPWCASKINGDMHVFALCGRHKHLHLDSLVNTDVLIQETR
jgi:hypothetical protein